MSKARNLSQAAAARDDMVVGTTAWAERSRVGGSGTAAASVVLPVNRVRSSAILTWIRFEALRDQMRPGVAGVAGWESDRTSLPHGNGDRMAAIRGVSINDQDPEHAPRNSDGPPRRDAPISTFSVVSRLGVIRVPTL